MASSTAMREWRKDRDTGTKKLGLGGLCPLCWSSANNNQYNNNNNISNSEPQSIYYVQHRERTWLDLVGGVCWQQSWAAVDSFCTPRSVSHKHWCLHTLSTFAAGPEIGFAIPLNLTWGKAFATPMDLRHFGSWLGFAYIKQCTFTQGFLPWSSLPCWFL